MLITLLLWVYYSFILLSYGGGIYWVFQKVFGDSQRNFLSIPILLLLGLYALTWLTSIISIFTKMGFVVHSGILIFAFIVFFLLRTTILNTFKEIIVGKHWAFYLLIFIGIIVILLYAVKTPSNPDTSLYHAQAIHWIEEYAAIPGLGNLDPRLGANSNWFVLNALFSLSFLGLQSFHVFPAYIFLISFFYFVNGIQNLIDGDKRISQFVKIGFIPLAFYFLANEISSPGTDLPVFLFYWLSLGLLLEVLEKKTFTMLYITVFFLSLLVITFKLSGAFVSLIAMWIFYILLRMNRVRLAWMLLVLAVALIAPWMIRNFILNGYWLYPIPFMQYLSPHVDWAVPVERVLSFERGIQGWALAPGTNWETISEFSNVERLGFWIRNLTVNRKGLVAFALISPVVYGVSFLKLFWNVEQDKEPGEYWLVVLISYINLIFWLLTAPNIRFGYGFLTASIVVSGAPILRYVYLKFPRYHFSAVVIVTLLLVMQLAYTGFETVHKNTYIDMLIFPTDYENAPTNPCEIDGRTFFCAKAWRQCGYNAFPCLPQAKNNIELRGETLSEGFRISY